MGIAATVLWTNVIQMMGRFAMYFRLPFQIERDRPEDSANAFVQSELGTKLVVSKGPIVFARQSKQLPSS